MSDVEVRPATSSDAPAIERVGRETWPSTYGFAGEEYIAHGLETWWSEEAVLRGIDATRTFVAESHGEVVGMGNIDLRHEKPIIWKLYVLPDYHGCGAGNALMARLLVAAPPGSAVLLEYSEGNARAAVFYEHHGFVELRRDAPEVAGWPVQVWMVHHP
ncbi:MAG: GNAT family N-acetyltransferase [Nocardioidaceae bacterium]|nr:GNAT family N-acetyltransferase [Nocardioidaceae bacterium]